MKRRPVELKDIRILGIHKRIGLVLCGGVQHLGNAHHLVNDIVVHKELLLRSNGYDTRSQLSHDRSSSVSSKDKRIELGLLQVETQSDRLPLQEG